MMQTEINRPKSPIDLVLVEEIGALERLDSVLRDEAIALKTLDYSGIDQARMRKEELEGTLIEIRDRRAQISGELAPFLRARHRELCDGIRGRAGENAARLEASLQAVHGLIENLTGTRANTYGRSGWSRTAASRPVLTSTVG